jgi:hypothetical protein
MGAVAAWRHLCGLVVMGGFMAAGWALDGPHPEGYLSGSIYPGWAWVLVGAGATAGALLLLVPRGQVGTPLRTMAAAVALVVGAELTGTGIVAWEHWENARNQVGYGDGQLHQVTTLALAMVVAAGIATLAAATQLLASHAVARRHRTPTWWLQLLVGVGLVGVLPLLLATDDYNGAQLTTWGAAGLIYAGPWGAAIVLSAWSSRPAMVALLGSAVACAALATHGPQIVSVFGQQPEDLFLVVTLVTAMLTGVVLLRHAHHHGHHHAHRGHHPVRP